MKKSASADDIRKAFRKLARKYHPDVNPGDKSAEEKFKTLSEANDVLSDPKKRKIYDQLGFYSDNIDPATAEAYARGGGQPGLAGDSPEASQVEAASPGGTRATFDFGGFDFSDLFEARAAGHDRSDSSERRVAVSAISSPAFSAEGAARPREEGPEPGTDLEYQVNVPFWTAIRGGVMRLNIARRDVCGNCHGNGTHRGPGEVSGVRWHRARSTQTGGRMKFNVHLPALPRDGKEYFDLPGVPRRRHASSAPNRSKSALRPGPATASAFALPAKATPGLRGGAAGDLYAIIRTGEHPIFHRDGDDISSNGPVSATEAALGAKIEVPTIDGRAHAEDSSRHPVGPKAAAARKRRALGDERRRSGDEIVEVTITVPMPRDENTKELLRELAKLNPEDPGKNSGRRSNSPLPCRSSSISCRPSALTEFGLPLPPYPLLDKIFKISQKILASVEISRNLTNAN